MTADAADFYSRLPIFEGFANIMDPARYQPLPDDWLIGLTDVVSSTQAIENGRYKAVNTAGALVDQVACFAAGTRLQTDAGLVAVEDLREGMAAFTERRNPNFTGA